MRYILRCVIHAGCWERQLADIISVCHKARIEEVMLMEQSHQILMSPYPLHIHHKMADIYSIIADKLRKEGIEYSVNIATIAGHCDAIIPPEYVLPYTKFVSVSGIPNHSTYCILDEDWVEYAAEVAEIYAATHPHILMIDDDFRSVNHTEYLGCFCPIHLDRTNKKLGLSMSREELINMVLDTSTDCGLVRNAWMEVNFEGQLHAAEEIGKAARKASPEVLVGLMNSGEPEHSVQGRDMERLLKAFAGGGPCVSRPLGGAYDDALHDMLVQSYTGMSLSESVIDDAYIISEVENWPHTLYTKSVHTTESQMILHTIAGSDALSLNVYDYLATPYDHEPEFAVMLCRMKEKLGALENKVKGLEDYGVSMLWNGNEAKATRHGIIPSRLMDSLIGQMGISIAFKEGKINYLYGETAAVLTNSDILRLLSGNLIVSAEAIDILYERGFGNLLGITPKGRIGSVCVEMYIPSRFTLGYEKNMVCTNEMRFALEGKTIIQFKALKDEEVISVYKNLDDVIIGDAMVLHVNQRGGNILLLPTPISKWTYAFRSRADIIKRIIHSLDDSVICLSSNNVFPILKLNSLEQGILALVNTGIDSEEVKIPKEYKAFDSEGGEPIMNSFYLNPLEIKVLDIERRQNEK